MVVCRYSLESWPFGSFGWPRLSQGMMCLLAVWNSSCWEDVSLESLDGCQVGYITSDGRSWNDPYLPAHLLSRDIYTSTPVCHTHDSPNLDIFQLYRPSTYISQCPQQQNTLVKWRIASTPVPAPSIYTVFTSRPSLYTPDEGVSRKPSASVHAPKCFPYSTCHNPVPA